MFKLFQCCVLSVLFCVTGPKLYAERTHLFSFEEVHQIGIPSNYARLRVLDMRTNKDRLGYITTGAFQRSADLVTEDPFDKTLTSYFKKMVKAAGNMDSEAEMVMVVYDIVIEDKIAGQDIATFFMDADFYGGYKGKYQYLGTMDSLYELSSSTDVTKKLLKGAREKIPATLAFYATQKGSGAYLSEDQLINKRTADRQHYEAYKNQDLIKPGIYLNIEQFINNTPIDTPVEVKEINSNATGYRISAYYPKSRENKKSNIIHAKDVFAVYDGKMLVCSDRWMFTKLKYDEGDFYAVQHFAGVTAPGNAAMAGVMFGLVGAAIVAAADPDSKGSIAYYSKLIPNKKRFIPIRRAR